MEKIQNTWDMPKSLKTSKDFGSEDLNGDSKNSGNGTLTTERTISSATGPQNVEKNNDSLLGKRKLFQVETVKTDTTLEK